MSKPFNIKLVGDVTSDLKEGSENANTNGDYYTWNESNHTLEVFIQKGIKAKESVKVTYETTINSGNNGDILTNIVTLSSTQTTQKPTDKANVKVLNEFWLHVKQEVVNPNDEIVVPTIGYVNLSNVDINNVNTVNEQYSMSIPSYLVDTLKPYKDVKLQIADNHYGYLVTNRIPEFYKYLGFQLTTNETNHFLENIQYDPIEILNYKDHSEYWLTIYIEPEKTIDGPPFYNWDYKVNSFGKIKIP